MAGSILTDQVFLAFVQTNLAEGESAQDQVNGGSNETIVADLFVQAVDATGVLVHEVFVSKWDILYQDG